LSKIFLVKTDEDIGACFDAFKVLRPHIKSREEFVSQVHRQQTQSYEIVAVKTDNKVESAAGFRFSEFLAWGKILYLDDLTTLPESRGNGYGVMLMDWLIDHAKSKGCQALHLDTGYSRHAAHRLYLKKGLEIKSHHLSIEEWHLVKR